MTEHLDTAVTIMRAQGFHNGHKAIVDAGLDCAKEVIVVLGSCFQPRTTKNPFTFAERRDMVKSVFPDARVKVVPVMDYPYDDNAWVSAVQGVVDKTKTGTKTGLIGHSKDSSSYYLKIFPQWSDRRIEVGNVDGINATDIRNQMFEAGIFRGVKEFTSPLMPPEVCYTIDDIIRDYSYADYAALVDEYNFLKEYKEKTRMVGADYSSMFITTDAVLTQSGYVLLAKRSEFPFNGSWALPGGYVAPDSFITDNMINVLRDKTGVKIPAKVLKGSIKSQQVFDHPERDPRGRVVTHGFHVDLGYPDEGLPRVKGSDRTKDAQWFHLSQVTSGMMAFDHYHILKRFVPTY